MCGRFFRSTALALLSVVLAAGSSRADFATFSIGGDNTTASIQATVDAFRLALGNPNNGNAAGPLASGRREINWDGGGAATTVSATPLLAFQVIRGAIFSTGAGGGFAQVTPANAGSAPFNPTYATLFTTFSLQRIFSPLGFNFTDVTFGIPGQPGSQAAVRGFGAVFTDVDIAGSSRIEFYGLDDTLIYSQDVAVDTVGDAGLSFLGAVGTGELIRRVRIISGNTPIVPGGPNEGGGIDIVAMDDFLFGEPQAVPEPASVTLALIGMGTAGLALIRRRRKR